jgi:hypothetical protein
MGSVLPTGLRFVNISFGSQARVASTYRSRLANHLGQRCQADALILRRDTPAMNPSGSFLSNSPSKMYSNRYLSYVREGTKHLLGGLRTGNLCSCYCTY